jgi:hypothetical protein
VEVQQAAAARLQVAGEEEYWEEEEYDDDEEEAYDQVGRCCGRGRRHRRRAAAAGVKLGVRVDGGGDWAHPLAAHALMPPRPLAAQLCAAWPSRGCPSSSPQDAEAQLVAGMQGLGIQKLRGVPTPSGKHIKFDEDGKVVEKGQEGVVKLRGVPTPKGKHIKFDD